MKDQPSKPVWKLKERYANLQVGKGRTRFSIFHFPFDIFHSSLQDKDFSQVPAAGFQMANEKCQMENGKSSPPLPNLRITVRLF